MAISTRIYAGGSLLFGGQPAVNDLLSAAYSTVIVWSVHVSGSGDLSLNNSKLVSGGVYSEPPSTDFAARLAQLRKAGAGIIFSVGSGGVSDYANLGTLLDRDGTGKDTLLGKNFAALKQAMVDAGGDIDAIDYDNEEINAYSGPVDKTQVRTMTQFSALLKNVGYNSVTFCPYSDLGTWTATYQNILSDHGRDFVSAVHLQCYSGGRYNSPEPWGEMIANGGGNTLLIPGLATNQAAAGPWWNVPPSGGPGAPGGSVVKSANVAQFGGGDWSGMLRKGTYASAEDALKAAEGGETFFFYCRGNLDLGPGKQFQAGDAVYFAGTPQWGSAPQCDGYSLSGGCSDIYNLHGACPADLQNQFAAWKGDRHPPGGGFIWLYDSVVDCNLSGCCGGTEKDPATTAKDYRAAITAGLS